MKLQARETPAEPRIGETVRTRLASIAKRARNDKDAKFYSINHLMNKATLREAFRRQSNKAAPGIDGKTKEEYQKELEKNLDNLLQRLKSDSYKPSPAKRTYIPKADKGKRPLGIPVIEDKIVQTAMAIVMESIYEEDFVNFSFGFRPGKNCHSALRYLSQNIGTKQINYVVDADIRGYFNHINHEWLMKFIKHRITDGKILRLVSRFLKAGVMEDGQHQATEEGVPQGGSISPLLANIYLHYVLDLWFAKVIVPACKGAAHLTRYADDFVACFQSEKEARWYYEELKKRLAKFGLEIAEEKTRIIEFGRYVAQRAKSQGKRKPETFDFLGFTHYCGKTRTGRYKLKWKTARKRLNRRMKEISEWIRDNRHLSTKELWSEVNSKLRGHYQHYGVSENSQALYSYRWFVIGALHKWLNRRSQRNSFNWKKFKQLLKYYPLEKPKALVNLNPTFVRRGSCVEPDVLTGQVRF